MFESEFDALMDVANFAPMSVGWPSAWGGHLPFAAWCVRTVKPSVLVELGTHTGSSYFAFCEAVVNCGLGTKCYAVDTWQGDQHAGFYENDIFRNVNEHNEAYYATFSRLLRMTFDDALAYFSDGSIDLLHIDGLHTYEAVRHDFNSWLPKLAPGAIVLFHDTNVRERGFGVWRLWEELSAQYPNHIEFSHSYGLGVLQVGDKVEKRSLFWLQSDFPKKEQLQRFFAALGARQIERFELSRARSTIASLHETVSSLDHELQLMVHSRSWRVTRPLRCLLSWIRARQKPAPSEASAD